jgi:hypothetical protein
MLELMHLLTAKGVKNTLAVVEKMNSVHVTDDFHRLLVQYLKHGHELALKEKTPLLSALRMTLFEVVLPAADEEAKNKTLKELISAMEQFYAGMINHDEANQQLSMELAVEHVGEEVSFYVAVPDTQNALLERQLLAVFPHAKIYERKNDYNIFNNNGVSVGAVAVNSWRGAFPIKTYEEFEQDPLSIILNSFSKLAREGEGAAIQLLLRPAPKGRDREYLRAIKETEKGLGAKKAIEISTSFGKDFWHGAKNTFFSSGESSVPAQPSEMDRVAIEKLQKKTASPLLTANLRIVASAPTQARAAEILSYLSQSFRQFADPQGQAIEFKNLVGKELDRELRDFSFRLFADHSELTLNLKEVSTLLHFPVRDTIGAREVKQAKAGTAPAPINLPRAGILMGQNEHRGVETPIYLTPEDRLRHMYVIGQTGTGKTTLLTNMIVQDIKNGDGCCFIDPHGSDVQYILGNIPPERYEDVIYFDPAYTARPMALNMLEYDSNYPEQKTFVVNELLGIFNKLFDMKTAGGPMFEQYFRNSVLLVMEDPESGNTLLDVSRVLADENYRRLKLSRCRNPIVKQYWEEVAQKAGGEAALANIVPYITSKFDVFLSNDIMRPIIAQENSSFRLRQVMDERKILLINLSKGRLGDLNANLIGLIIVGKILMAALSRVDSLTAGLPPFYLYIDEFQNVTTDSISTILSEARKYGLSLNVAHQFIAQLEEGIRDSIFGNVGSMAVYRVGAEDAKFLEQQFVPTFTVRDIMSLDNYNYYARFLTGGQTVKPFSVQAAKPIEANLAHVDKLRELSYLKYGKPRAVVEEGIMAKYMAAKSGSDTSQSVVK